MAKRIFMSDALTNWVSRACSTVFWLSFNISLSNCTVLPSLRPELAVESTAELRLEVGDLAGVPAGDGLLQLAFKRGRDVQPLVIGRLDVRKIAGDRLMTHDSDVQHLFGGQISRISE